MKCLRGGRVVGVHALITAGVNAWTDAEGQREILGLQISSAEDAAGRRAVFRYLTVGGLSGVAIVTPDARRGWSLRSGQPSPARHGNASTSRRT